MACRSKQRGILELDLVLGTFATDHVMTMSAAEVDEFENIIVSESGIRTVEDVRRVVAAGVHAALIGESLMRASDPSALLESFLEVARG